MRPPPIAQHGFPVSRKKLGAHYRSFFVTMAVFLVAMTLWNTFTADDLKPGSVTWLLLANVGILACLAGFLALQWRRESNFSPALSIGPEGIHDRRRWRRPIPWSRIKAVRPLTQEPERYKDFKIEVEGRNDISRSGLQRLFDNWIVHPMGGDPGFTVSFVEIESGDKAVATLVRKIVAAAEA